MGLGARRLGFCSGWNSNNMGGLRMVLHSSAPSYLPYEMKGLVWIVDFQSVTPALLKGNSNRFLGLGHGHVLVGGVGRGQH